MKEVIIRHQTGLAYLVFKNRIGHEPAVQTGEHAVRA
jgi:hypothetical protein